MQNDKIANEIDFDVYTSYFGEPACAQIDIALQLLVRNIPHEKLIIIKHIHPKLMQHLHMIIERNVVLHNCKLMAPYNVRKWWVLYNKYLDQAAVFEMEKWSARLDEDIANICCNIPCGDECPPPLETVSAPLSPVQTSWVLNPYFEQNMWSQSQNSLLLN